MARAFPSRSMFLPRPGLDCTLGWFQSLGLLQDFQKLVR